ncbi:MAG: Na+/glucose cotransporter, partial [Planctomycetota bacterium]
LIFIASAAVMVVASLVTAEPDYRRISGLTFGALTDEDRRSTRESWGPLDVVASLVVIGLIIAAYVYFSG